jgi:hypothetical protein
MTQPRSSVEGSAARDVNQPKKVRNPMHAIRRTTLAVVAGASVLSLAACAAGITTAGPAAPATAHVPGGAVVHLTGALPSFPVPVGAHVLSSGVVGTGYMIVLTKVSVQAATRFYGKALPATGYSITNQQTQDSAGLTAAAIKFTGHGYNGEIGALSGNASAAPAASSATASASACPVGTSCTEPTDASTGELGFLSIPGFSGFPGFPSISGFPDLSALSPGSLVVIGLARG